MTAMAINTTRAYLFWLAQSLWVEVKDTDYPWSSLEEGGDGVSNKFGYFPLYAVSIVFKFINTTAYHLGRYEPSYPVSCRLPGLPIRLETSLDNRILWVR